MWKYYRNGVVPKRNKQKSDNEVVNLPPIPNGITTKLAPDQQSNIQSTAQRLQELFFSSQALKEHGLQDKAIRKKIQFPSVVH